MMLIAHTPLKEQTYGFDDTTPSLVPFVPEQTYSVETSKLFYYLDQHTDHVDSLHSISRRITGLNGILAILDSMTTW